MTCTVPGPFYGMSNDALRAALAAAQNALIELMSGKRNVSFSYTQGDGTKAVSRQMASVADCRALIQELQRALGITTRARRPLRPVFR